jgi:hypothetical protein
MIGGAVANAWRRLTWLTSKHDVAKIWLPRGSRPEFIEGLDR